MQISKRTWLSAQDQPHARELLYDMLAGMEKEQCRKMDEIKIAIDGIRDQCTCRLRECEKRFDDIEKAASHRTFGDKMWSAAFGLVGGAAAVIGKMAFWK